MFEALTALAPTTYLAVIGGLLVLAAIQQITIAVKSGTIKEIDADRIALEDRLHAAGVKLSEAGDTIKKVSRGAAKTILKITATAFAEITKYRAMAIRTAEIGSKALGEAANVVETITAERDEAIADRDEVLKALHSGDGGTVLGAKHGAPERDPSHHLDSLLFGGTPFRSGGLGGLPLPAATFAVGKDGKVKPIDAGARFLVKEFGPDFLDGKLQTNTVESANLKPVTIDDLKAAIGSLPRFRKFDHDGKVDPLATRGPTPDTTIGYGRE